MINGKLLIINAVILEKKWFGDLTFKRKKSWFEELGEIFQIKDS